MIDLDEVISRESAKLETAQDLEFKISKRETNYMILKQKVIATASVINSFKACKIQCQEKDIEIKSLKDESATLRNEYKKTLLDSMTLDKNYEELVRKFDFLNEQNAALEIKEKSTQALNKQLQNLLMATEEKLENSEKEMQTKKRDNDTLKAQNNQCNTELQKKTQSFQKKITSLYKSIFKFGNKAFLSGILTKEEKIFLYKCKSRAKTDGVIVEDLDSTQHLILEVDDILDDTGRAGPPSCASTDTGRGSSIYTSDDEKYPSAATTPTRDSCFSPKHGDFNSSFDVFAQSNQNKLNFNDVLLKNISKCITNAEPVNVSKPSKISPVKLKKIKSPSPVKKRNLIDSKIVTPKVNNSISVDTQVQTILNEMKSSVNLISPMPSSDEDMKDKDSTANLSEPVQVRSKKLLRKRFRPIKNSLTRKIQQKSLKGITSYLMALTKKIAKEEVNKVLQTSSVPSAESNQQKPATTETQIKSENSNPVVIIQGLNNMNQVSIPQGPGVYIINNIPSALTHQLLPSAHQTPAPVDNLSQCSHVNQPVMEAKSLASDKRDIDSVNTEKTHVSDKLLMNESPLEKIIDKQPLSPNWNSKDSNNDVPVHVVSPVRRNPKRLTSASPFSENVTRNIKKSSKSILKKKTSTLPGKISKKNFKHLFDSDDEGSDLSVLNKPNDITLNVEKKRKRITSEKSATPRKRQRRQSSRDSRETLQNDSDVDTNPSSTIVQSADVKEMNHSSDDTLKPPIQKMVNNQICDKKEEAIRLLASYYKKKENHTPIFINRKIVKSKPAEVSNFDEIMKNISETKVVSSFNKVTHTDPSLDSEEPIDASSKLCLATSSVEVTNEPIIPAGDIQHVPEKLDNGPRGDLVVHNYDMFCDDAVYSKEEDKQIFASIIRNNMTSKKKKIKASTRSETSNVTLYEQLEDYLLNDFSKARLDTLLEKIRNENEKSVALAMVTFVSQGRDNDSIMIRQLSMSPMNCYQQTLLCCINRIRTDPPPHFKHDIVELVMRGIENKSLVLGNTTPCVRTLSNLATFYTVLCRITKQKDKLKLFCMDAIYCYSYKAIPIVYAVLQSWPQVFPQSHHYVANDPLIVVMIHCLQSNFSEKIEYQCHNMQRLLSTKYGFKPGTYNDDGIIEYLMHAVKELNSNTGTRNLQAAFLLLGKRFDVNNCHKKIIIGSLLPVLNDAKANLESRAFVAGLIGPLVRPFPASMLMESEIVVKKLSVMLNSRDSPMVEEALASSLTYLSKKNFNLAVKTLVNWQPMSPISEHTRNLMTSLVSEKPYGFWKNILASA